MVHGWRFRVDRFSEALREMSGQEMHAPDYLNKKTTLWRVVDQGEPVCIQLEKRGAVNYCEYLVNAKPYGGCNNSPLDCFNTHHSAPVLITYVRLSAARA